MWGGVSLFVVDGRRYIKTCHEQEPDEYDLVDYIDSNGLLHPQIVQISQNDAYKPKEITSRMDFRVVGRVLI